MELFNYLASDLLNDDGDLQIVTNIGTEIHVHLTKVYLLLITLLVIV